MHAMGRGGALVLAGAAPSCSGATGGFGGKVADFRIGCSGGGEGRSSIGVEGGGVAALGGRGRRCGWIGSWEGIDLCTCLSGRFSGWIFLDKRRS